MRSWDSIKAALAEAAKAILAIIVLVLITGAMMRTFYPEAWALFWKDVTQ
jgi:hypothetical protein